MRIDETKKTAAIISGPNIIVLAAAASNGKDRGPSVRSYLGPLPHRCLSPGRVGLISSTNIGATLIQVSDANREPGWTGLGGMGNAR
jgi:hypothetical protein